MKPAELPRALLFKLAPELNAGKSRLLDELHAEWQRVLPLAFDWYWRPFLRGGLLPKNPPRSGPRATFPATSLVTSQKDLMALAIEGQAKSWASNLKNRVTRTLMRSTLDPQVRRQMLWINAMRAWLLPYPDQVALLAKQPAKADALTTLSPQASRWLRKQVRGYIAIHRLPGPLQLPLQVNQLSATVSDAQHSRAGWARHWLRLSTLERGQRINIPVLANAYAQELGGRRASTFSLVKRETGWYAIATQYLPPEPWTVYRTEVLAIDLGLRNLLATSEGDLRGQGFLTRLQRYDAQLIRLQRGLQQAGEVRLSQCRRYRLFVKRLRGWLKTTIQTHLRQLLDTRRPRQVVIEDLCFVGAGGLLSRRMNRLLRRFGQGIFQQTLAEKQQEYGFELAHVEPAYSSQTCSRCGFVHRSNRHGDVFKCQSCGHRAHADVNAAKNLAGRSGGKATSVARGPQTQWVRSLGDWLARQRAAVLAQCPSGLLRQCRAVGCARAGLRVLVEQRNSANKLSAVARAAFLVAASATSLEGLLNGLSPDWLAQPR